MLLKVWLKSLARKHAAHAAEGRREPTLRSHSANCRDLELAHRLLFRHQDASHALDLVIYMFLCWPWVRLRRMSGMSGRTHIQIAHAGFQAQDQTSHVKPHHGQ